MRPNHFNRQSRRAALCIGSPRRRDHELGFSPRRIALTAHGDQLAQVAARIAQELELSPELLDLLAPDRTTSGSVRERTVYALSGAVPGR